MEFFLVSDGGGIIQGIENTVQGHENMVIPGNSGLVLKFVIDNCETQRPLDESEEIIKNFCAVLNKSWKFIFPNEAPPRNPHHYNVAGFRSTFDHHRVRLSTPEDRSVEICLDHGSRITEPQLRSIIWRMANAFEWCALPNRKRLSGQSSFTRETWNAISVYRSASILAKTTSSDSPALDLEPAVSDPQAQTDAAE
jgi:hypothetical protein